VGETDCDVDGGTFFADGEARGDGEGEGDGFDCEAGWDGLVYWGRGGVRCESEETFHDEACDDAFNFTDSTSRCVGGKTFHQKRRSKRKQHLNILSAHILKAPAIQPLRNKGEWCNWGTGSGGTANSM
jgi:hypothetical protein